MAANETTNSAYSLLPKRLPNLPITASPFPGSLSVLSDVREECCAYAVVSGSNVVKLVIVGLCDDKFVTSVIQPFGTFTHQETDGSSLITGVKWCYLLSGETVLVITSFGGFTMYDSTGSKKLFQYRITHNDKSTVASCTRGIASVGNSVCIGSYEGHILVFTFLNQTGAKYEQQLETMHSAPITSLSASRDGKLASADERGKIVVWNEPVRSTKCLFVTDEKASNGYPCTQVCWYKEMLIGCYGNGTMAIYNGKTGTPVIEACGHSRLISAVGVASDSGLILTVSEDSTICIWQLTTGKTPQLSLVHNRLVENVMLCGSVMCDKVGSMFAVVGYGTDIIMEYAWSVMREVRDQTDI